MAGMCILKPLSQPGNAFLIVSSCGNSCTKKSIFLSKTITDVFTFAEFNCVCVEIGVSEPQNAAHNKSWKVGGMSQPLFFFL